MTVALPPLTTNSPPVAPLNAPPNDNVPLAPVRSTPLLPPAAVTDVKPVKGALLVNAALVVTARAPPLELIATSRTLSAPAAVPVIATAVESEVPMLKPASVLFEPSVSALTGLVIVTEPPALAG